MAPAQPVSCGADGVGRSGDGIPVAPALENGVHICHAGTREGEGKLRTQVVQALELDGAPVSSVTDSEASS